jgi:hypothetical protein
MNRFVFTVLALAALDLTAAAAEKTFKPSDGGRTEFDTPSLNMCCTFSENVTYYPEGSGEGPLINCTRVAPKYWIIELRPDGKVIPNKDPGEVPGCGYGKPIGNVLGYGDTTQLGPYVCSLERDGLTCKAGGKGFKLSRKGLKNEK